MEPVLTRTYRPPNGPVAPYFIAPELQPSRPPVPAIYWDLLLDWPNELVCMDVNGEINEARFLDSCVDLYSLPIYNLPVEKPKEAEPMTITFLSL